MVLTKFEMHGTEGVDHSKQVSKKQHPKVFEELSCIMEKDFFCIIFGPVFGNYRKKNFRARGVFCKRRNGTKMPIKVVRFLQQFKGRLDNHPAS